MIKISEPPVPYACVLEKCKQGIGNENPLRPRFEESEDALLNLENEYRRHANPVTFHKLAKEAKPDDVIAKCLTKEDMLALYKNYFVPSNKPARELYDRILFVAKDSCPYCGGIGTPSELDHFLPKAYFSRFAILPINLIPACLDCNKRKGSNYAEVAGEQTLHPYLDAKHFFAEQWIHAKCEVDNDGNCIFQYYPCPPASWSDTDKARVKRHFDLFRIATRYAIAASRESRDLRLSDEKRRQYLKGILGWETLFARTPNHWKYGMFDALSAL